MFGQQVRSALSAAADSTVLWCQRHRVSPVSQSVLTRAATTRPTSSAVRSRSRPIRADAVDTGASDTQALLGSFGTGLLNWVCESGLCGRELTAPVALPAFFTIGESSSSAKRPDHRRHSRAPLAAAFHLPIPQPDDVHRCVPLGCVTLTPRRWSWILHLRPEGPTRDGHHARLGACLAAADRRSGIYLYECFYSPGMGPVPFSCAGILAAPG